MALITSYQVTKSYTAMLLDMFDNMQLNKQGALYTIPIYFADREKLVMMLDNKSEAIDTVVPAMALKFNFMEPNLDRATNRLLKKGKLNIDGISYTVTWNDTPMDYRFTLNILTRTMTDMTAIVEYITSKFKNRLYYMDYKSPVYDDYISTPIILETVTITPELDESFDGRSRMVECQIDFVVQGVVHNSFQSQSAKIEQIEMYLSTFDGDAEKLVNSHTLIVDANGVPSLP